MKGMMSSLVSAVMPGLIFALSACATAPSDADDSQDSASQDSATITANAVSPREPAPVQPFPKTEPTTSTWWMPGKLTYVDLWPPDHGITSAQVVFHKEIDSSTGPTHVAFVVWNGTFVGRIYRIHNNADGADFLHNVQQLNASRVNGVPDNSVSSSGSATSGNPKPPPHPNVDDDITYLPRDLDNARVAGRGLLSVTTQFLDYKSPAVVR
jgi:hypothetical protein